MFDGATTHLPAGERTRAWPFARLRIRKTIEILLLTCAVVFLDGYHPFANDAGIYVAGTRRLLDPSLYRPDAAFVLAHTRLSIFAHVLAAVIRLTHVPLPWLLFAAHPASVFLFLLACSRLAERLFLRPAERLGAIAMAAACFSLPVAGTALAIMDPYVTARSFDAVRSLRSGCLP